MPFQSLHDPVEFAATDSRLVVPAFVEARRRSANTHRPSRSVEMPSTIGLTAELKKLARGLNVLKASSRNWGIRRGSHIGNSSPSLYFNLSTLTQQCRLPVRSMTKRRVLASSVSLTLTMCTLGACIGPPFLMRSVPVCAEQDIEAELTNIKQIRGLKFDLTDEVVCNSVGLTPFSASRNYELSHELHNPNSGREILLKTSASLKREQIIAMVPPRKVVDRHVSYFFNTFDLAPGKLRPCKPIRVVRA